MSTPPPTTAPPHQAAPPFSGLAWPEPFSPLCQFLLHQQCWLWGQDIRRPDGNLLLHYGFERSRPPLGVAGGSRYQIRLSARSTLSLWGFGLYYARRGRGGVFLGRYDAIPRPLPHAGFLHTLWSPFDPRLLPPPGSPCSSRQDLLYLASRALLWIASYEEWVLRLLGPAYRHDCLRLWRQPSLLPSLAPQLWRSLASSSLPD